MKTINLTSDRVRLPQARFSLPQLNRALPKLQLPFPVFKYAYRLGRQNIPAFSVFGSENKTAIFFGETSEMEGDGGEVETRDYFTDAALLRTLTRESSRTVEMKGNDQGDTSRLLFTQKTMRTLFNSSAACAIDKENAQGYLINLFAVINWRAKVLRLIPESGVNSDKRW